MKDATAKRLSRLHTVVFRGTKGRVGKRLVDNDMLLLTTTGRHSGDLHTVPLLFLSEAQRLFVFASWGGRDSHPDWYSNLLVNPEAMVELPTHRCPVTATTLTGTQRAKWWGRAVDAYAGYATYQSRTGREIPVVALDPLAS